VGFRSRSGLEVGVIWKKERSGSRVGFRSRSGPEVGVIWKKERSGSRSGIWKLVAAMCHRTVESSLRVEISVVSVFSITVQLEQ